MKSDRLLSVLLLLQARGRVTERELAERLEVSQRTIHRDLEALSASRVPVTALRGSQGGWELDKGWRTQVPGLDESELRALLMAQPRVVGNSRLAAAAASALNKLMAALPGPMREQAAIMRERLHVDPTAWWETGEDLSMLSVVQDAVARERQLAFDYIRADGQRSARTVDPLGLVAKGQSWYLVARGATGMRTFRVSRMTGATVLATGFDRPAKFDLAAHWARSTAELEVRRRRFSVVLALAEDSARMLMTRCRTTPMDDHKVSRTLPDGWVTLEAHFDDEAFARFVILGLGASARAIAPDEFCRTIRAEVALMAAEHHDQRGKEKSARG
ncbi:MAG TPA: WYL domain-containing protein [Terracidiphilus sp.]|nr:WYL domain-containing protein [Terracidiphilus sp.]